MFKKKKILSIDSLMNLKTWCLVIYRNKNGGGEGEILKYKI